MQQRKSKKILIYFFLLLVVGSINNINLNSLKFQKINNINITGLDIKNKFKTVINLLLVKTTYYNVGDFNINEPLQAIITNITETENATTFQGVLEHYKSHDPDVLCVVRRKRGFFIKKWEKNTILKKDFYSTKPVLVLSGLK